MEVTLKKELIQNIHKRFCEIFGGSEANPFAGKEFLLFGDLLQLPRAKSQHLFVPLKSLFGTICNPWSKLLMCGLTEVKHQQGDNQFILLLNPLRISSLSDDA